MTAYPELLATRGPAALESRDARWLGLQRRQGQEMVASALLGLSGILVLGWPGVGMLIFLLLSLWLGLLTDFARMVLDAESLRRSLAREAADERLWALVRALRSERPEPPEPKALPAGPGLQLGIAIWIAVSITGALVYEVRRVSEIDLVAEALSRPDMLVAIGILSIVQLAQAVAVVRHQGAEASVPVSYTPVFDVVMFMILMFFWMVISGIVVELGELAGDQDPGRATVTVFVVVSYGLLLWRGVGELQALKAAEADMSWLRDWLASAEGRPESAD